jgi:hypothetical protein
MEKLLCPLEFKNVSYEGNTFKFQKKLKGLTFFTATLLLMFFSSKTFATSKNEHQKFKFNLQVINLSEKMLISNFIDTISAEFNSKTSLKLDVKKPLSSYYIANISLLKFASSEESEAFFNSITDNILSYTVDFKAKTVLINLHLEYSKPEWTVTDWNVYINSKLNPQH